MPATATAAVPRALGLGAAAAQFALALSWTVYVVFLPTLAVQAGLPAAAVIWLLVVDQAVFLVADYACGVASDRVLALHRRLAPWLAGASALSAAAFLALPWLAPQGSPLLFVVVTLLWTATSSVLRAPPLNLLGRHAALPAQPALVALVMLGLGLAAALAPWLAVALKGLDPRGPFVLAAAGVVLASLALAWAEGRAGPRVAAHAERGTAAPEARRWPLLLAAALLAALAFQWHTSVNAAAQYRRFVEAAELPLWLPVFWAGFNLALWPALKLARGLGAFRVLGGAALLAALAAVGAALAPSLGWLAAAQALAGTAWAALMAGGFTAALALGHTGREGRFSGAVSSSLAGAAALRLVLVAGGGAAVLRADGGAWADALPALLWALSGWLLWTVFRGRARAR